MTVLVTSIIDARAATHSRFHELISCLAQEDHALVVWPGSRLEVALDLPANGLSSTFVSSRGLPIDEGLSALSLPSRLRRIDFDLVVNYNTLAMGIAASLIAKKRGVPVIYDLADDLAETAPHYVRPRARRATRFLVKSAVRANLRLADRVTCTTETLARKYGLTASACTILPNGVDVERFRLDQRAEPSKNGTVRLVFVGGMREWLDFRPVLEGIRLLKARGDRCHLSIFGGGPGVSTVRVLAAQLGVAHDVAFRGPIPYERVPEALALADVCLLPFDSSPVSLSSLPLKLLEYMAAGRPVISSPLPEIQRLAGDVLWYARTGHEYAAAIQEICDHRYSNERLSAGVRLVADNYSWRLFRDRLGATISLLGR